VLAQDRTPAQSAKARFSGEPVTLNFVNADLEAVSRAMGAMLEPADRGRPARQGHDHAVYSEQPIPVREAYLNYLAALRGLGFTVVETAGLLKVVPEADAKLQTGTVSGGRGGRRGDQILTQIFRSTTRTPNNLVAVLRPLISPNNTINANPGNNTLVITDYADNLQRIGKIIAAWTSRRHRRGGDPAAARRRPTWRPGAAPGRRRLRRRPCPALPAGGASVSVMADPAATR
jgi:general secretion pathway protein D